MYNQEFWVKYIFRLSHMISVIVLGGKIILDHIFPN
jgi:hypothetical protein